MKWKDHEELKAFSTVAVEEVRYRGYSVISDVLTAAQIEESSMKLDKLMKLQEAEVGKENIYDTGESNVIRLPMAYDEYFMWHFLNNAALKNVLSELLGSYHQLHSQNGILIQPQSPSQFSAWHRDFQFIIDADRTIAVTAMYCLQDLASFSGSPVVLPFSHKMEKLPSAEFIRLHQVPLNARAGSLIIMDSLLYHRAGPNNGSEPRRSVKHIYTSPMFKQEIDIPSAMENRFAMDPYFSMVLGYNHHPARSVKEYRNRKISKIRH